MEDSNFWKLRNKFYSLEEMDLEFRLAALIHCSNMMEKHSKKYNDAKRKSDELKASIHKQQVELTNRIKQFEKTYKLTESKIDRFESEASESCDQMTSVSDKYDILVESILDKYNINVPENVDDLRALKQLVKSGVIKEHQAELI